MQFAELQGFLSQRFNPQAAAGFDATFRLAVGSEALDFRVSDASLNFGPGHEPDATFRFRDVDTLAGLLTGHANVIDAFMDGSFKADGYLMWAFALLGFFRGGID